MMSKSQMTISVIVPVYKVEDYLCRCVDSILMQNFADFELVLVDDGSPDNCGKICDEYAKKDKRITVIHKKNGGLSDARNAGIDWAFKNSDSAAGTTVSGIVGSAIVACFAVLLSVVLKLFRNNSAQSM